MPENETARVGVIGLGRMGSAICGRLCETGFDVRAHDVRPERAALAAELGAVWSPSATELAARSDVVLTLLPAAAEVELLGETLLASLASGDAWIDMSTAAPATAQVISPQARAAQIRYLDAPLAADPAQAQAGDALVFAGGSKEDVDALGDILGAIAQRVLHVGPSGNGYLTKLLVNLLWFGQAVASAEALAIAARAGLDPHVFRAAAQQSPAAGRFLDEGAEALLGGDDMTSFSLAGCHRELAEVVALAHDSGVPAALSEFVRDLYAQALAHYGDVDGELLAARLVLERSGVDAP